MRHMIPALLLAALTLTATAATAGLIGPACSIVPTHVSLVGLGAAGPDSALGHFTVTVLDLACKPMPGEEVVLDLSGCPDLRIAADQHDPRLWVGCRGATVVTLTDANGVASFTVVGASYPRAATPAAIPNCGKLYAYGVLLCAPVVSAYDIDGVSGVGLADIGWVFSDYFGGTHPGRSDYDGNGVVSLADLGMAYAAYFAGHSTASAATWCP